MDARASQGEPGDARGGGRPGPDGWRFELTGGALCLDLANTVDNRLTEPKELLPSYASLLAWGRQAGVLDEASARALAREAASRPAAALAALRRAREAREAIYAVFSALAGGAPPPPSALAALNAALPGALARLRLRARDGAPFEWAWDDAGRPLDRVLWPALRSAAELLTGGELPRLRLCAAEECGWLFLDHSKNATRRWCDMRVCGNRSKVRRFYARRKASG
jgi:predicted RNA-binding Zn ribbon-like protein